MDARLVRTSSLGGSQVLEVYTSETLGREFGPVPGDRRLSRGTDTVSVVYRVSDGRVQSVTVELGIPAREG